MQNDIFGKKGVKKPLNEKSDITCKFKINKKNNYVLNCLVLDTGILCNDAFVPKYALRPHRIKG